MLSGDIFTLTPLQLPEYFHLLPTSFTGLTHFFWRGVQAWYFLQHLSMIQTMAWCRCIRLQIISIWLTNLHWPVWLGYEPVNLLCVLCQVHSTILCFGFWIQAPCHPQGFAEHVAFTNKKMPASKRFELHVVFAPHQEFKFAWVIFQREFTKRFTCFRHLMLDCRNDSRQL